MYEKTKTREQPQTDHDSLLNRRRFLGVALGAIAAVKSSSGSVIAPERGVVQPDKVSQAEINELETNLYDVAQKYGLSLAPKGEIQDAFHELGEAQTETEATSIMSAFTERHLGFSVNDTTPGESMPKIGIRQERLLSHLCLMPRELYEAINLVKIDVGRAPHGADLPESSVAGFLPSLEGSAIILSPVFSDSLHITLHEISHGLDYESRPNDDEWPQYAAEYLYEGGESEYIAEISASWMMGDDRRVNQAGKRLTSLLDRYDALLPGLVAYVEEALQPYLQAYDYADTKKDYFFQPQE